MALHVGLLLACALCSAWAASPNATQPKPKLMVVFASRAGPGNATETPRTMLLFEDADVDRSSEFPEEPSAELLPPLEDAEPQAYSQGEGKSAEQLDGVAGRPEREELKPGAGYDYQRPQQDAKPATGYDYPRPSPRPQQDEPQPAAGYNYPKPQQDTKPATGYDYPRPSPRPQQDEPQPAAGYNYPKPQQDSEPTGGYDYTRPQQAQPQLKHHYDAHNHSTPNRETFRAPQQDRPAAHSERFSSRPGQDSASWRPMQTDNDYLPPKQQLPIEDGSRPSYGIPGTAEFSDATTPVMQDELPYSYEPSAWSAGSAGSSSQVPKQPLRDESLSNTYGPPKTPLQDEVPSNSYGPPKRPLQDEVPSNSYGPPKRPLQDEMPSNSYGPPKTPLQDEVPSNSYVPPKKPLQDEVPSDSYLPPKKPLQDEVPSNSYGPPKRPVQDDAPSDSFVPPKKPLQDEIPSNSYVPPKRPLQDEVPSRSYGPPKRPQQDEVPSNSYGPPKRPQQDEVPSSSYGPPKRPLQDEVPSNSYGPPKRPQQDEVPSSSYGPPKHPLHGEELEPHKAAVAWADFPPLGDDEDASRTSGQARPRHLGAALRSGTPDEHGIRVTDMSCLRTASRSRFTATITSPTFVAWPPVLGAVAGGGAAPPGCRIIADPADPHHRFLVDLSNPDLTRCGVKGCSADGEARLCSRVVMPSLPGLRLASDPVLVLQCTLQPATGSVLQQARLVAAQPTSTRSATAVHAGGERAPLHAHLQLFRRGTAGEFSRQMQPGGAVHLGDELQLRASVRRGDGWQSCRLSDVVVRRGAEAVQLVSAEGCTNPEMRAVCPRGQAWLPGDPLVSLLTMKVFMFRGMQDGDQLVVTARVVACLDRGDCKTNEGCDGSRSGRTRRSGSMTSMTSFEDSVAFVVRFHPEPEPTLSKCSKVQST